MAKFIMVSVKDELTGTFKQPIFGENEAELIRVFKYQVNAIPIWKSNPSDWSLYELAEFDDSTGQIIPNLKKIVNGTSVLDKEKKEKEEEAYDLFSTAL